MYLRGRFPPRTRKRGGCCLSRTREAEAASSPRIRTRRPRPATDEDGRGHCPTADEDAEAAASRRGRRGVGAGRRGRLDESRRDCQRPAGRRGGWQRGSVLTAGGRSHRFAGEQETVRPYGDTSTADVTLRPSQQEGDVQPCGGAQDVTTGRLWPRGQWWLVP